MCPHAHLGAGACECGRNFPSHFLSIQHCLVASGLRPVLHMWNPWQTTDHIVNHCPITRFPGGLWSLHQANRRYFHGWACKANNRSGMKSVINFCPIFGQNQQYAPPIRPRLMALYKCALIDWLIDFCLFCKNLWKAVQFILLITYLCSFFLLIAIGQVDNKLCIRMCNFLKYWNISWGREQLLSRSSPVCSTPYPLRGLLYSCCSFRLTFSPFQRRACTVRFIWSKESMEAILAGCHWIQTIA